MTTLSSTIACPHCNAVGQTPAGFCTACGKALPAAAAAGPRVLGENEFGSSSAARTLRTAELHAQAKKAAGALLTVAVIQMIFGTIILIVAKAALDPGQHINVSVFVGVYGIGTLFFGLYFWARKSPLPAAIVGLVLFITVHLLDAIADPTQIVRGIIFKIIIIAILVKAIQAGLQYRKLSQEQPPAA